MGVLQNASREKLGVFRTYGATILNSAYPQEVVSNWHLTGMQRNLTAGQGIADDKTAIPDGLTHPASWVMARKTGRVAARNEALPKLTTAGSIAAGRNIEGSASPALTATATGQLVVSGVGSASMTLTTGATVVAALAAVGSASPALTASATPRATGHMVGSATMSLSASATRYATGKLEGSVNLGAVAIGADTFSNYLLDEQDIETGLTLRQALRVVAAASAGKVSGAETTTIRFRNAQADTKDRIVATVDANGNRDAVTLDVS